MQETTRERIESVIVDYLKDPARNAISRSGHDKVKCRAYLREVTRPHVQEHQPGVPVNSCGPCQVKAPCESRIPVKPLPGTSKVDAATSET